MAGFSESSPTTFFSFNLDHFQSRSSRSRSRSRSRSGRGLVARLESKLTYPASKQGSNSTDPTRFPQKTSRTRVYNADAGINLGAVFFVVSTRLDDDAVLAGILGGFARLPAGETHRLIICCHKTAWKQGWNLSVGTTAATHKIAPWKKSIQRQLFYTLSSFLFESC